MTPLIGDYKDVTAQTLATLHQFPDRQLVGEDVIWTGYEDGSFLSSHRLISVMRHTGDGSYGKATGRMVKTRIIADCWVVNQVVTEEWLVRDQAAFPDAVFSLDSATVNQKLGQAVRAALRWSVRGTHTGFGSFGPPSGPRCTSWASATPRSWTGACSRNGSRSTRW